MNERRPKTTKISTISHWKLLEWLIRRNERVEDKLNRLLENTAHFAQAAQQRDLIIMSLETEALDELEAQTAAISGAEESAQAAFIRLADMIAALKTQTTDPETARRITAAADALRSKAASLAAAVEATPTA